MPLTSRRSPSSSGASRWAARYARSAAYESPASRAAPASASRAATRPLGALGETPAALGREPGGVRPPLLVAVGSGHRAEHVLRHLRGARALERRPSPRGSALPTASTTARSSRTPMSEGAAWASAWSAAMAASYSPRRAASTAASRVWAAAVPTAADEQARRQYVHDCATVHRQLKTSLVLPSSWTRVLSAPPTAS